VKRKLSELLKTHGFADYEHTEFEAPGEPGTVFTNEGFEGRLEAIQAENEGWSAAYGVQIRRRDFAAIGEEAFVPPTVTNQYGIYTFHEKEIGNVHLEGCFGQNAPRPQKNCFQMARIWRPTNLNSAI